MLLVGLRAKRKARTTACFMRLSPRAERDKDKDEDKDEDNDGSDILGSKQFVSELR